jgi:hypothetical protein
MTEPAPIRSLILAALVLGACHQNFRGPGEGRREPPPSAGPADSPVVQDQQLDPAAIARPRAAGPSISGTIALAPELVGKVDPSGVIYVIARQGPGPPLAVARLQVAALPVVYALTAEHVMMPGMAFEGELNVSARLDRDGAVGPPQPGDVEGATAGAVKVGDSHADIVLNQLH